MSMAVEGPDGNFDGITALRFLAAFLVVMTHATFYTSERLGTDLGFWWQGANGVNIFFVISGFVMVVSTGRLRERADAWRIFITRRLVRIVPMYWLATSVKLAALILVPAAVLHSELDPIHIVSSYFFIPTINAEGELKPLLAVGWTLYFEMFFYALFALGLFLRVNLYWFIGLILGACALLSIVLPPTQPATMFLDPIVLQFFFGMLIVATIARAPALAASMARNPLAPAALAIAGFLLLILLPFSVPGVPDALKTGIPAAMIVLGTAWLEPRLGGRLPKWLLLLGDASYALYLFHPLILPVVPVALRRIGVENYTLSVVICVIVALIAGVLVHLLIERPLTRMLKARLEARPATRLSPTPMP
jgi:peptidoglycan/LPS O-acetylase OafA/YrhL